MINHLKRLINPTKTIKQSFINFATTPPHQQKLQENIKDDNDDVHTQRYLEQLKLETQGEPIYPEQEQKEIKKEFSKYIFNSAYNAIQLSLDDCNIINIENESTFHRVPKLQHELENVVHYPGIYFMDEIAKIQKDQGKFLRNIPQPDEIDFDKIPLYIPPSNDQLLLDFAKKSNIKYVVSTSTISSALTQIYYMFSGFRNPLYDNISSNYENEPKKYMISQRKPTTNYLRRLDKEKGIYAFDSDSGIFEAPNKILMDLGKILEKQLTLDEQTFKDALLKTSTKNILIEDDHHRFMKLNGDICLRSQIDCTAISKETNQPIVFEIKTRASCPIRYDLENYKDYLDYRIVQKYGIHSSFEREYYDLIRGGFLKYCFQLKIGRMDGAFIAYHNTLEMFGFEYVKTTEIENRIFGNTLFADASFVICSKILTNLLNLILDDLHNENFEMLKIGIYCDQPSKKIVVFIELFDKQTPWSDKKSMQKTKDICDEFDYFTKVEKFENTVYKYEYQIFPFINGIQAKSNNYFLQMGDLIDVKYKFKKIGKASFNDYMNFLHDAYKFDTINLDLSYSGVWLK
ncbi:mitochondrial mRNA processing protein, putative [Ichthyophthirius multifiliis]|uniref:Mitochondrial mRNA processing protein, putative n=1 Tax=Ichthyophthirius multifiliis TaxID=5932 RepID=G0QJA0_ICHMU|nr:mitochondrial mRNA processing protein, putative [Ichthyophthirius multifiliis]EGR34709.1 mitochondrial mRNA processing protein, putative [Ichthyophthirius multifiliis]|eukprot:XP_004040013.1 mitochondrial mRNA processing protein, putative [Ichthyophthirius multifiliis]